MNTLMRRIAAGGLVAGIMIGIASEARASIFNFNDVYYVSNSAGFATAFSGYGTNTGQGYTSAGYYQLTQGSANGGVLVRRLGGASAVPGEYLENTATNATAYLALNGWYGAETVSNGKSIGSVYNTVAVNNGGSLYFQYRVGTTSGSDGTGALTPFTFNSFDLRGNWTGSDYTFVLTGQDGSGNTIKTDTLHVTGNTLTTFTENWVGVSTVGIFAQLGGMSIGGLYMDNVVINNTVSGGTDPIVPEPSTFITWSLLGTAGVGLTWWRKRKAV